MRRQSGWIAGQLNVTNDRSTPPLTQAPEAGEAAAVRYVLVAKGPNGTLGEQAPALVGGSLLSAALYLDDKNALAQHGQNRTEQGGSLVKGSRQTIEQK